MSVFFVQLLELSASFYWCGTDIHWHSLFLYVQILYAWLQYYSCGKLWWWPLRKLKMTLLNFAVGGSSLLVCRCRKSIINDPAPNVASFLISNHAMPESDHWVFLGYYGQAWTGGGCVWRTKSVTCKTSDNPAVSVIAFGLPRDCLQI